MNKAENIQHMHDITYTYRGLGDVPLFQKIAPSPEGIRSPKFHAS